MNILLLLVLLYCGHLAEGVLNILIDLHGKTIFHVPDVFELVCVKKKILTITITIYSDTKDNAAVQQYGINDSSKRIGGLSTTRCPTEWI